MTKEEAIIEMQRMKKAYCNTHTDAQLKKDSKIIDALDIGIKALEQEHKTWRLDDAREDFVYDVYNTLDFLPTNDEANRIIDSFDRVTSGIR